MSPFDHGRLQSYNAGRMDNLGEVAALLASVFFSFTAVISTLTSRQVGAQVTNRVRLVIALIYLMIINLLLYGQPMPIGAGVDRWFWLGLSGIIGLALGDMFLFSAYQLIGAQLGMLLLSLAPVFGAVLAWIFLGEILSVGQLVGMGLTLSGIVWVVIARPAINSALPIRPRRGVLFGVLAAVGQAVGLALSKQGMAEGFPPFAANAIRMLTAAIFFWLMTIMQRQGRETIRSVRQHPAALRLLAIGAFVGPVLGISASLLAVQHAEIGVASTLMSLSPVFLLPISYFVFQERFGWQTITGTLVAIAGVALLFLV